MSKVIAVSNQKGGVGKTTTAVNLGVELAREGKKMLLIECDQQGSILGIEQPDELDASLFDIMRCVIEKRRIPPNYALHHHEEGVDFTPANIELSGLEFQMVSLVGRE